MMCCDASSLGDSGSIVKLFLSRQGGYQGKKPALVLSLLSFNKLTLLAMVAPITSRVRGHGFEVILNGRMVSGAILCQQVKMIDFTVRGITFAEKAPDEVINTALAKVRAIVSAAK